MKKIRLKKVKKELRKDGKVKSGSLGGMRKGRGKKKM